MSSLSSYGISGSSALFWIFRNLQIDSIQVDLGSGMDGQVHESADEFTKGGSITARFRDHRGANISQDLEDQCSDLKSVQT